MSSAHDSPLIHRTMSRASNWRVWNQHAEPLRFFKGSGLC